MVLLLDRCPACRARVPGEASPTTPCRRCGSDLSLSHAARGRAASRRRDARAALSEGRVGDALRAARQAIALVDCAETRRTLAAALLADGCPAAAARLVPGLATTRSDS